MTVKKNNVVNLKRPRVETCEQALERLYREHGASLRSFLLSRVRNEAEVEDITQEVFARLARMDDLQGRLPVDGERNKAFIFQAANNLMVDMERRNAVRRDYLARQNAREDSGVCDISPDSIAVAREELVLVKNAILKLKPVWRKAFTLNRFKGLSHKAISEEMGVTVKQVEHYIANAMVRLREATVKAPLGFRSGESDK